jgi:hypothetical protein
MSVSGLNGPPSSIPPPTDLHSISPQFSYQPHPQQSSSQQQIQQFPTDMQLSAEDKAAEAAKEQDRLLPIANIRYSNTLIQCTRFL